MRITKIRGRCWGQHAAFDYDLDAAVVGIMGTNGTGKSTILKGLQYGLNGVIAESPKEETMSSFILLTETASPKSAELEVFFRKHGNEGSIERKVVRSGASSRTLNWEGGPWTKASDVDPLMADLMGASKRAVSNIVFIPQEQMNKVLFGTQTEREVLFLKLLLLEHLEDVVKHCDKQIAILSTGLQDHSVALDEVMAQRKMAEEAFQSVLSRFTTSRDWTAAIELVRRQIDQSNKVHHTLPADVEVARRLRMDTEEKITAALAIPPGAFTGPAVGPILTEFPSLYAPQDYSKLEATVEAVRNRLSKLQEAHAWKVRETSLRQQVAHFGERVQAGSSEVAELEPLVAPASQEDTIQRHALEVTIQNSQQLEVYKPQLVAKLDEHAEAVNRYDETVAAKEAAETAWNRKKEFVETLLTNLTDIGRGLCDQIKLRETLLAHQESHTEATCAWCRQKLPAELADPAELARLQENLAENNKNLSKLTTEKSEALKAVSLAEMAELNAKNTVERLSREFEVLEAKVGQLEQQIPPAFSREAAQHQLNQLVSKETERSARETKLRGLQTQLQADKGVWNRWCVELATHQGLPAATYPEASEQDINAHQTILDVVTPRLANLRNLTATLNQANRDHERVTAELVKAELELESLDQQIQADAGVVAAIADALSPDDKLAILRQRQAAHQQLAGEKRQLEQQTATLITRQRDIEKKIEENLVVQEVIVELKQLKDLFKRDGLPMVYCQKKFTELAKLTQQFLAELGTGFIVEPDPDAQVTFRFRRLDKENSTWLPQNKLSGGQRVRVSMAFLLAVQRMIIPDTGLLVIDEPLDGLDDESVEAMIAMLAEIETKMANSEFQIIVVTHRKELEGGLRKIIKL